MMRKVIYNPIGIIHTPFRDVNEMPIQPIGAKGIQGTIAIEPEYVDGIKDLEGFSHIFLIYHFHLSQGYSLRIKPFMDDDLHGVFATRAPKRPNPIGISVVRLVRVEGTLLHIEDVDMVDGTPLLDIKPYVPEFDAFEAERIGWLSKKVDQVRYAKSDKRFK